MHACMHACTHICFLYACMHVCMYACMHVCMHVCMYVCTYVYTYVYILDTFMRACVVSLSRASVRASEYAWVTCASYRKPRPTLADACTKSSAKNRTASASFRACLVHPPPKAPRASCLLTPPPFPPRLTKGVGATWGWQAHIKNSGRRS